MNKLLCKSLITCFIQLVFGCLLLSFTQLAFAAKNPISWSLNEAFPATVIPNSSYVITYTFTNQLPFTLAKPIVIDKSAHPSSEFSFADNCTGLRLTSQQSCTVAITLTATSTGPKKMQLTIAGYSRDRVPVPELATSTSGNSNVSIFVTPTTQLPSTMNVGDSASFNFVFTNSGSQTATGVNVISSSNVFSSDCNTTHTLAKNGGTCSASGTFTPTSATPTNQAVTATLTYTQSPGTQIVGASSTMVNPLTGISGVATQGLPPLTIPSTNYDIIFTFTNNDLANHPVTTLTLPSSANLTSVTSNCPLPTATPPANMLNGGASCTMTGTFNAATTGTDSFSGTLAASGATPSSATVITSTTIQSAGGARTFTFVNQCNFPVWFSLNGGAINKVACNSDADCVSMASGTFCGPANNPIKYCFWYNYTPADGIYKLDAVGGSHSSNTVIIPAPAVTIGNQQWSGNVSASLACDSGSGCLAAPCNNNNGTTSCALGKGFIPPAIQAEFTLLQNGTDSYDVESINGFHVPIEMAPTSGVTPSGYYCGSPGAPTAGNGFSACNWDNAVVPSPSSSYYWVTATGASCNSCSLPNICGYDINHNQVCGAFLGYWTPNQLCAVNSQTPGLNCNLSLGSPYPANTYTLSQLYACADPNGSLSTLNSCYLGLPPGSANPTNSDCCGCVNWGQIPGITLPSSTVPCPQNNPTWWGGYVQGSIEWMKKTCANYYSYPFDDKSSSFTCSNTVAPATNTQNYTITFCPGGHSGLPSGVSDGRAL